MKFTRWGTSSYHGEYSTEITNLRVSVNPKTGRIELRADGVPDFYGRSRHDYKVEITGPEFEAMRDARRSWRAFRRMMPAALRRFVLWLRR